MSDIKKYSTLAESISLLLHPFAEVVLHDIKKNKIAAIFNNHTKRCVGDESHIENIEAFSQGPDIHGPFVKNNFSGHPVKYSTTVLRNDKNEAIGLLCININIEQFLNLQHIINNFLETKVDSTELDELFDDNWQDRIRSFVQAFLKEKGKSLSKLSKRERMNLVQALQQAGAFRAKNAANFTANVLGVSRATIYNYLSKMDMIKKFGE